MYLKNIPEPQKTEVTKLFTQLDEITMLEIKKLVVIQIQLKKNHRFNQEILHSKRPIEQFRGCTQIYDGQKLVP